MAAAADFPVRSFPARALTVGTFIVLRALAVLGALTVGALAVFGALSVGTLIVVGYFGFDSLFQSLIHI